MTIRITFFITIADKMSWSFRIQPNTFWWRMLLASGIIDHSLLVIVGPSLDILTWTATSGYQLYKWMKKKPNQQVVILEIQNKEKDKNKDNKDQPLDEEDDFVLISHSMTSSA
jgi:hypothetical protein